MSMILPLANAYGEDVSFLRGSYYATYYAAPFIAQASLFLIKIRSNEKEHHSSDKVVM
jgi:hypothetical protein